MDTIEKKYPVMPLKNTVLFPQQVIPIYVGRKKSLKLIEDLDPDNSYISTHYVSKDRFAQP